MLNQCKKKKIFLKKRKSNDSNEKNIRMKNVVKFTNKKKKRKKDIRKVRTKARKIERKEDRSKESV